MIRQRIYIEQYDWTVWCYYAVDCYYVDEIADKLGSISCEGEFLDRAVENMKCGNINHGLTYSNSAIRESVLVVGIASSKQEFFNSLVHETFHLTIHIADACGMDIRREPSAYLAGEIAEKLYPITRELLYG